VGQFRRVEAVVDNPHGLRAVADQGAQRIERVGRAVRLLDGRVRREHHVGHALPDEDAHRVGALGRAEDRAQPAHVALIAHAGQRAVRHVQRDQQQEPGHGQPDERQPRASQVARQPAQARGHLLPLCSPTREQQQAQHGKDVQPGGQAHPRAAALRVDDGNDLDDEDEQIPARTQRVAQAAPIRAEHGGQAVEQAFQRQEHGHNQIGRDENRVAHVGRDPLAHVAAPGQRVQPGVLDDAVDADGQARQDDRVQQAADLVARAQVGQHHHEDGDVAQVGERALHPDIRAEEADARDDRQRGAEQIARHEHQRGQHQRRPAHPSPQPSPAFPPAQSAVQQLHHPCNGHQQGNGAHQVELVRFEDAV